MGPFKWIRWFNVNLKWIRGFNIRWFNVNLKWIRGFNIRTSQGNQIRLDWVSKGLEGLISGPPRITRLGLTGS